MSEVTGPRFCGHCGRQLTAGAKWCGHCGAALDVATAPAATTPPADTPVAPAVAPDASRQAEAAPGPAAPAPRASAASSARRVVRLLFSAILAAGLIAGVGMWPTVWARFSSASQSSTVDVSTPWARTFPSEMRVPSGAPVPLALSQIPELKGIDGSQTYVTAGVVKASSADASGTSFEIEDQGQTIAVFYPAARSDIGPGTPVTFVAMLSNDGKEAVAVALSRGLVGSDPSMGAQWLAISAACVLLAAMLFRIRRPGRLRRGPDAAIAVALVLTALLAGCEVGVRTTVNANGSGTVVTTLDVGEEAVTNIKELPNSQSLMDSLKANAASRGETVTVTNSIVRIERPFSSFDEYNASSGDPGVTWTSLSRYSLPDGVHMVMAGHLDAASLLPPETIAEGQDDDVRQQLRDKLKEATMAFSVALPGHTVADGSGAHLTWNVPAGGSADVFAETVSDSLDVEGSVGAPRKRALVGQISRWLFAVAAGLALFSVIAFPWRKTRA